MTTEAVDWRSRPTINVEEAGQILGVGRSTAYTLARNGQLPTLRLGRKFLVPTATLRRMLGEMDPYNESEPGGKPSSDSKLTGDSGRDALYSS